MLDVADIIELELQLVEWNPAEPGFSFQVSGRNPLPDHLPAKI